MTDLLDAALAAQLGRPLYDAINKHLADGQRAEAAVLRVRALAARIRQGAPWTASDDDTAAHILRAVDGDQVPAEPPVHIGGRANAEDCPACTGTNPPYPFICPGGDEAGTECKPEAATLNSTAANASRVEPDDLREQLHAAIESEVYEYRERTMWWPETGGVTEEIARLATRGALEALGLPVPAPRDEPADAGDETGAWTPDPPIGCLNLSQPKEQP